MKNTFLAIILATFTLAGCTDKQSSNHQTAQKSSEYYNYNPNDTIGNPYFFNLLKIDSARIYYKHSLDVVDSIMDRPAADKREDDSMYIETSKTWYKILDLAAKNKWKESLQLYRDNHVPMYIALIKSDALFNADYQVFALQTYDHYPESEANQINLRLFEEDYLITASTMAYNENYYPEHIVDLTWVLSSLYAEEGNRNKALKYLELYKLSLMDFEDPFIAQRDYTLESMNIYTLLGEPESALQSLYDFRNYVIQNIEDEEEKSFYLYQTDEAINDVKSKQNTK